MFGLFAKPRRRSRSRGGGGGKALDTIIMIGGLGALGVGAYFLLKSRVGVEEFLDTGGDFLKKFTDAINSTGEAIGRGSYEIQKGVGGIGKGGGGGEDFDIIGGIQDAVGGYSKGVEREIRKNEDRSLISRDDILGFGCGWLRKC